MKHELEMRDRPGHSFFSAWLRGSQIGWHNVAMSWEVIIKLALVAVVLPFLLMTYSIYSRSSKTELDAFYTWAEAGILSHMDFLAPKNMAVTLTSDDGLPPLVVAEPTREVQRDPYIKYKTGSFFRRVRAGYAFSLSISLMIIVLYVMWTQKFGRETVKAIQLRGQVIQPQEVLVKEVEAYNRAEMKRLGTPSYRAMVIAGVPLPVGTEREHIIFSAATGSGKSQLIHSALFQVRQRGERAIVFDPDREFIKHHYDPLVDKILNPFDKRSVHWSPFADASSLESWDQLAAGLFKDSKSGDPYWVTAAREIFVWTCYLLQQKYGDAVNIETALRLMFGPVDAIAALVAGTPAAPHLAGADSGRVSSLHSSLIAGLRPMIYLAGSKGDFSIKKWVNEPNANGGFLFLGSAENQKAALKPFMSNWIEIALNTILSRTGDGQKETLWIVVDEMHSAGRIDALADGPERLRKYGGAMILSFQQISQLNELYGIEKTKTIIGQCLTKVIMRSADVSTAHTVAEIIGRRTVRRMEENTSFGANSLRDGVGLTPKEELEFIILPEDALNWPAGCGAIRVANARKSKPFPVALINVEFRNWPIRAKDIEPIEGDPIKEFLARRNQGAQPKGDGAAEQTPAAAKPVAGPGEQAVPKSPANPEPGNSAPAGSIAKPTADGGGKAEINQTPAPSQAPEHIDEKNNDVAGDNNFRTLHESEITNSPVGTNALQGPPNTEAANHPVEKDKGVTDPNSGSNEANLEPHESELSNPPRRVDLPDEEAARLVKAEENARAAAAEKAKTLSEAEMEADKLKPSTYQKSAVMRGMSAPGQGEESQPAEHLGGLETAVQADIVQAIADRGHSTSQLLEGLFLAITGVNLDIKPDAHGHTQKDTHRGHQHPHQWDGRKHVDASLDQKIARLEPYAKVLERLAEESDVTRLVYELVLDYQHRQILPYEPSHIESAAPEVTKAVDRDRLTTDHAPAQEKLATPSADVTPEQPEPEKTIKDLESDFLSARTIDEFNRRMDELQAKLSQRPPNEINKGMSRDRGFER